MKPLSVDEALELVPELLSYGTPVLLATIGGKAHWKFKGHGSGSWQTVGGYSLGHVMETRLQLLHPTDSSRYPDSNSTNVNGRTLRHSTLKAAIKRYAEINPGPIVAIQHRSNDERAEWLPGDIAL